MYCKISYSPSFCGARCGGRASAPMLDLCVCVFVRQTTVFTGPSSNPKKHLCTFVFVVACFDAWIMLLFACFWRVYRAG